MDKRPVRRVHQPDHGVVDRRREADALDEIGWSSAEPVEYRDLRRCGGIVAEEHPNVPLHLAHRVAAHTDTRRSKRLTRNQRRDQGALSAGIEAPTVIAAFDLVSIEPAGAERHAAMRTWVAQSERGTGRVTTDQDRLAEHDLRQRGTAPQASARHRVIPSLAQWRGRVLRSRCSGDTG